MFPALTRAARVMKPRRMIGVLTTSLLNPLLTRFSTPVDLHPVSSAGISEQHAYEDRDDPHDLLFCAMTEEFCLFDIECSAGLRVWTCLILTESNMWTSTSTHCILGSQPQTSPEMAQEEDENSWEPTETIQDGLLRMVHPPSLVWLLLWEKIHHHRIRPAGHRWMGAKTNKASSFEELDDFITCVHFLQIPPIVIWIPLPGQASPAEGYLIYPSIGSTWHSSNSPTWKSGSL